MAVATLSPHATSGVLNMFGGTKDGKEGWIDFEKNTNNINHPLEVDIVAEDMRFMDPKPTFAKNGYEFRSAPATVTAEQLLAGKSTPESKKVIDELYMTDVVKIIKEATGGADVVANGFRLRTQVGEGTDILESKVAFGSVNVAHVDRDPDNAHYRLATSIGEERAAELLEKYKGKKWASVNVWRPIGTSVQKWPLCFVNRDNVPDFDYHTHMTKVMALNDPAVLDRGTKGWETVLLNKPGYKFHYASNLSPDECYVFASFHSDPKMVVPHGAFWDNGTSDNAPTRSSIEARCWVFWDEDQ